MSIERKLARAISELNRRGVLVLEDPEINTTRVERVGRSWRISRRYDILDDDATWVVSHRADVETEIRSWLKCQEQLDSL